MAVRQVFGAFGLRDPFDGGVGGKAIAARPGDLFFCELYAVLSAELLGVQDCHWVPLDFCH